MAAGLMVSMPKVAMPRVALRGTAIRGATGTSSAIAHLLEEDAIGLDVAAARQDLEQPAAERCTDQQTGGAERARLILGRLQQPEACAGSAMGRRDEEALAHRDRHAVMRQH